MSDRNRISWLESFSYRSFQFIGFVLATYFASIQVADYWKNENASLISFTKYHTTKNDKYPTFSICYTPGDPFYYEYLYQEEKIKEYLGINASIYNSIQSPKIYRYITVCLEDLLRFKLFWETCLGLNYFGRFGIDIHL